MKNITMILILMGILISTHSMNTFAGDTKGDGQILVEMNNGDIVPYEYALALQSREYLGLDSLPEGDVNPKDPFLIDFKTDFLNWISYIEKYSPNLAKIISDEAKRTPFIYINHEVVFPLKAYPNVGAPNFTNEIIGAMHFKGKVYISLPAMARVKANKNNLNEQEMKGFVLVHEMLNKAKFFGSFKVRAEILTAESRLELGKMLIESKLFGLSKNEFLARMSKLKVSYMDYSGDEPKMDEASIHYVKHVLSACNSEKELLDFVNFKNQYKFTSATEADEDLLSYEMLQNNPNVNSLRNFRHIGEIFQLYRTELLIKTITGKTLTNPATGRITSSDLAHMAKSNDKFFDFRKINHNPRISIDEATGLITLGSSSYNHYNYLDGRTWDQDSFNQFSNLMIDFYNSIKPKEIGCNADTKKLANSIPNLNKNNPWAGTPDSSLHGNSYMGIRSYNTNLLGEVLKNPSNGKFEYVCENECLEFHNLIESGLHECESRAKKSNSAFFNRFWELTRTSRGNQKTADLQDISELLTKLDEVKNLEVFEGRFVDTRLKIENAKDEACSKSRSKKKKEKYCSHLN